MSLQSILELLMFRQRDKKQIWQETFMSYDASVDLQGQYKKGDMMVVKDVHSTLNGRKLIIVNMSVFV